MKDLEKASELARKYAEMIFTPKEYSVKDSLLEMAQWKEQQMIDKACEWLKDNLITVVTDIYIYTASVHNIDREEFIEQFKKAMEEQL